MGDAIEMTALTKVFAPREGAQGQYKIGSVKPNIGHGESVSGMSQITKVILSIEEPNPSCHLYLVPKVEFRH